MVLVYQQRQSRASAAMIKSIIILATILAFTTLSPALGHAESDKAPCGSFQKLADGTWKVVGPVKIETDKGSGMLSPGTTISPGKQVAGVNIYAALQRSCH
jgi:hypothetical protein